MRNDFLIATHAMVYLYHRGGLISSDELAQNICTTGPKVREILSKLMKFGLVQSRLGSDGGYSLAKADVGLDEVASAVDAKFIGALHVTGDMDKQCLVSSQMGPYMEDLLQGLDRECLKLLKSVKVSQVNDDLVRLSKTDEKGRKDRQSQPSGRMSSDG